MISSLHDLRVATKLFTGFGVIALLVAALAAVGITRQRAAQADLERLSSSGLATVQAIGDFRTACSGLRLGVVDLAVAPEAGDIDAYISIRDEAVAPIAVERTELLDDLSSTEVEGAAKLAQRGDRDFRTAVVALLLIGAAAAAVAVVVAVAVSRSIVRPVTRTLEVVQGLSQARLDQRVGHVGDDEIGRLVAAVDLTMDKLTTMVRAIIDSSRTLAGSSEELSAVATQLSSGATQSGSQSQVVSA
ncbi:methyl-accepting chemotaxis protein, partial [Kineococcus sp. TRM81007]|uniref:HAMP domain-containing protein n=1 Tax=Kineococcus sp. TRM81007 TaxID=2925831 RepID=UPI001F5A9C54